MIQLEQKIEEVGLVLSDKGNYNGLDVYIADYKHSNDNIIGRYIFVYCDDVQFEKSIYENGDFVSTIIQPIFFECRSDLSWNLYLVCILKNEDYNSIETSKKIKFQVNKKYTRNIIITLEEFTETIPIGKVVLPTKQSIKDPLEEWKEQLKTYSLEFCLDKFSSNMGIGYLNNTVTYSNSDGNYMSDNNDIDDDENMDKIHRINSLKLTQKYRPFCFGGETKINFSNANLLTGANGVGKTSILQAIELAMTGEIRKTKKKEDSRYNEIDTEVELVVNEDVPIVIPKENIQKRIRESLWYKRNPKDVRTKTMLNDSFHRYNQFTVEDTVIFSYLKEDKVVEESYLTKILFGENTTYAYENINKYKKWFESKIKDLQEEYASYKQQLSEYEIQNISKNEIVEYVEGTYLDARRLDSLEGYKLELVKLQTKCLGMKDLSRFTNKKDILREVKEIEKKLEDLNKEEEALAYRVQKFKQDNSNIVDKEKEILIQEKEINKQKYEIKELVKNRNILTVIRENIDIITQVKELYDEQKRLNEGINKKIEFYKTYEELLKIDMDYSLIRSNAEIYEKDHKLLIELKKRIKDFKIDMEKILEGNKIVENIITTIRHYGEKYIEQVSEVKECPLCGNDTISKEKIIDHIEKNLNRDNYEIEIAQKKLDYMQEELLKIQRRTNRNEEYTRLNQNIDKACEQGIWNMLDNPYELDKLAFIKRILKQYEDDIINLEKINQKISIFKNMHKENLQEIERYDLQDTYLIKIKEAANQMQINVNEGIAIKEVVSKIIQKINRLEEEFKEQEIKVETQLIEIRKDREKTAQEVLRIEDEKEKLRYLINNKNNYKATLQRGIKFFEEIYEYIEENKEDINIIQLENYCKSIVEMIDKLTNDEKNKKRVIDINRQIEKTNNSLIVAKKAYKCLDSIMPLNEYGEKFIVENIAHISKVFLMLHSPREFDGLRLNKENDLVGIRGEDEIELSQMSTGQRTAVILAVFFNMNAILEDVPNFILIDEPVANIDDMNILSLLDFLREMVIRNNKQIFFTTANYNVGKLFRRKFSFMEREFSELVFERDGKLQANIIQKSYNIKDLVHSNLIDFSKIGN